MAQIHETQAEQRAAAKPAAPAKTRRFRLPRPAIALPVLAAGLAGVVAAGVAVSGGGAGLEDGGLAAGPALTTTVGTATTKGVPQLLDRIALAAAEGDQPTVKPGQYIYIESKTADTFLKTVDDKTTVAGHTLHTRQVWESPDGTKGWLIDPAVNDSPEGETLSLPDEQGNTPEAYLNAPSHDYLAKLTTDPDTLLAKIYKETEGRGNSPDQQAFTTIGDLLGESYPRRSCTRPCSRPPRRFPVSSWSTTRWTRWVGMVWRWPGWTRPAVSARSGSSTGRPTSSWASARFR